MRALLAAAVAVLTIGTLPLRADAQTYPPNPFDGQTLYAADWFGDWNALSRVQQDVDARVDAITAAGAYPVLVAYDIPHRDCAGHSGGGAGTADGYRAWIRSFKAGIGSRQAAVILEPDALAALDCLSAAGRTQRLALLADATRTLAAGGNVAVYLDAGHADSSPPVSSSTRRATVAVRPLASRTRGATRPVGDSGAPRRAATGDALVDAFLWIKRPGESDGTCRGGPPAGTWWRDYAVGLVARAA